MKNLPLALRQAKNQFGQDSPWLILLDLDLTVLGGPTFRLVANNEDIEFNDIIYTAFPLNIELPKETNKGEIPSLKLSVSNITRMLQVEFEKYSGGVGSTCRLYIVNASLLTENYAELTMDFEVISSTCSSQWVEITLGASNPLRRRFPLHRYIAAHCNWQYRSIECGYNQSFPATCNRTLSDCITRNNGPRFGGFKGLASGSLRLA
jgi:lambda family phage minor tail protein L